MCPDFALNEQMLRGGINQVDVHKLVLLLYILWLTLTLTSLHLEDKYRTSHKVLEVESRYYCM